ncbi:hypothetical protein ATN89_08870 [Comamonas thiooxydans]|nr:hypothetical protein ATN89_08870 [Comamonas thiooxydans]
MLEQFLALNRLRLFVLHLVWPAIAGPLPVALALGRSSIASTVGSVVMAAIALVAAVGEQPR